MNRTPYGNPLPSGMQLYRVKLVGGPYDGAETLVSHDVAFHGGERYVRGPEDLYIHDPIKPPQEEPCPGS